MDRALDRFWSATGSPGPLRLLVWHRGRHGPAEHRIPTPFAILGRTQPADLVLDHPQVSRRHAFIQVIGDRAFCLDLGSRSALGWNGRPRRSGWIEPGQPVEVGPFRVGLAPADPGACPPLALPGPASAPRFVLESAGDAEHSLRRWPIDRVVTCVGRAAECDLMLADLSISRHHCVLIRLGSDLWVVDLLGRGGVEVDARPRRWARLADGAMLRLGRYLFTVRARPASRTPAPTANLPAILPGLPAPIGPLALPAPADLHLPLTLDGPQHGELSRLAEAMVAPLIDQFTAMQQQLFDQYHQSMMEMVAVFTRMHHAQRGLVDRELRKIRRLTREVRALRRELDSHRDAAARPHPGSHGASSSTSPRPLAIAAPRLAGEPGAPEDYRAAQARIIARMTELQQERQGRWQRLLGRLGGAGPDDDR